MFLCPWDFLGKSTEWVAISFSGLIIIKEIQIQITMGYYNILIRMSIIKNIAIKLKNMCETLEDIYE